MQSAEGRDLERLVQENGPLPVAQAVEYVIQAARALEKAHAKRVVHGDVRPASIVIDRAGIVRLLDPGSHEVTDADHPIKKAGAGSTPLRWDAGADDGAEPEPAREALRTDPRADIYGLGCTLYYLLTGQAPLGKDALEDDQKAHPDQHPPRLRTSRPDVPARLEVCYEKMTAKLPVNRPQSMTEVISLLEETKLERGAVSPTAGKPPKPDRGPRAAHKTPEPLGGPLHPATKPSLRVRPEERESLLIKSDFNLEDPSATVTRESRRSPETTPTTNVIRVNRSLNPDLLIRSRQTILAIFALAGGLLLAILVGFVILHRPRFVPNPPNSSDVPEGTTTQRGQPVNPPHAEPVMTQKTIFDGHSARGWMLCNRAPLPPRNVQRDGLNPHRSGSYLVVYEHKLGDFVLDFDYKLANGSNSGVFLRVSDLNDPVQTGIEISLDDRRYGDDRDSGGFVGLSAPREYTQKPAGQWNHMTITASGPLIAVSLNGKDVSSIDLDTFGAASEATPGPVHLSRSRPVARMARIGYLGFQDLGGDCWFNDISLRSPPP